MAVVVRGYGVEECVCVYRAGDQASRKPWLEPW